MPLVIQKNDEWIFVEEVDQNEVKVVLGQKSSYNKRIKDYRGRVVNAWYSGDSSRQLLIQFQDGSLTNTVADWFRDDGLADIEVVSLVGVESINHELKEEGKAGILESFVRRVTRHASSLKSNLHQMINKNKDSTSSKIDSGIYKIIIVVTIHGKIYGLDGTNGKILWHFMTNFNQITQAMLFAQQNDQSGPRCTLTFDQSLLTFDPTNGRKIGDIRKFDKPISQSMMIHNTLKDGTRPIMLILEDNSIHFEPSLEGEEFNESIYIVTMNKDFIYGHKYNLKTSMTSGKLPITWSLKIAGSKLIKLVGKPFTNIVHSQGRVMADRSVLFKYVNPNLAVLMTENPGSSDTNSINIFFN